MKYVVVKIGIPDSVAAGKSKQTYVSAPFGVFDTQKEAEEAAVKEFRDMVEWQEKLGPTSREDDLVIYVPKRRGDRLAFTHRFVVMPVFEPGETPKL